MQPEELIKLADKVQHFQCEFQNIEVKAAQMGCPTRLYDTLSSFSNQENGGVIIFGLNEKENFDIVGVYDIQDLQHKVAEQCKQMEPEVRPLFSVAEMGGKFIVSAEIPEVDAAERPVYYKGAGRMKGSFVRVGESDEPMNEYEIYTYDAFRKRLRDDIRAAEGAKMSSLREDLLKEYLDGVKMGKDNVLNNMTDDEILEMTGVCVSGQPTLAGEITFGKYPQGFFPQLCITAIVVPGEEIGDVGEDGERFIDNRRFTGTIGEMLQGAVDFVKRNSRVKTVIDENGERSDKPEFPIKAVREVILNALLHRDYSIHTEGTPITLCMFSDRMEVTNKGGLYGRISTDQLGKVRPETRNPALANMLEILKIAENRYSGIPTIRKEMKKANLPSPEFLARNGEFKVVLRNNITQSLEKPKNPAPEREMGDKFTALLSFCRTPRSREEITEFLGFSRYYAMKIIKNLLAEGRIDMTIPEKPKSKKQRYVAKSE